MNQQTELYLRNVIFGISDSLVSTVGLLAGIDVGGTSRQVIIVSAKIVKVNKTNHALKMMLLGGAVIVIGVIVGKILKT